MTMPAESDLRELRELATSIFDGLAADALMIPQTEIGWNAQLWQTLENSGLTLLTTPTDCGGSGAGLAELSVVLESAARSAAPAPIAETDLLASWLLQRAGISVPAGPLASAHGQLEITPAGEGRSTVTAVIPRVAWARVAEHVVVLGQTGSRTVVLTLPRGDFTVDAGVNVAYEPRDTVRIGAIFDDTGIVDVSPDTPRQWRLRGAFARSASTIGYLDRVLELTVDHASQRSQFGRPIAKFQAVQHMISAIAGEVTATQAAHNAAVKAAVEHGIDSDKAEFAVAAAKAQASRAASTVSAHAHQVHGAIGFTLDHQLRHFTLRSLAAAKEFGDAREWNIRLGQLALGALGDGGAKSLWHVITDGAR